MKTTFLFKKYILDLSLGIGLIMIPFILYHWLTQTNDVPINQLIIVSLTSITITFRLESMVNFHDFNDHIMRINYWISSIIADISLIGLLYKLPGGQDLRINGWIIILLYIILRFAFYLLMYYKNLRETIEINQRLKDRLQ